MVKVYDGGKPNVLSGEFKAGMLQAAKVAASIQPSAASAAGEAHMRGYRDAIVHAIEVAAGT